MHSSLFEERPDRSFERCTKTVFFFLPLNSVSERNYASSASRVRAAGKNRDETEGARTRRTAERARGKIIKLTTCKHGFLLTVIGRSAAAEAEIWSKPGRKTVCARRPKVPGSVPPPPPPVCVRQCVCTVHGYVRARAR